MIYFDKYLFVLTLFIFLHLSPDKFVLFLKVLYLNRTEIKMLRSKSYCINSNHKHFLQIVSKLPYNKLSSLLQYLAKLRQRKYQMWL